MKKMFFLKFINRYKNYVLMFWLGDENFEKI